MSYYDCSATHTKVWGGKFMFMMSFLLSHLHLQLKLGAALQALILHQNNPDLKDHLLTL